MEKSPVRNESFIKCCLCQPPILKSLTPQQSRIRLIKSLFSAHVLVFCTLLALLNVTKRNVRKHWKEGVQHLVVFIFILKDCFRKRQLVKRRQYSWMWFLIKIVFYRWYHCVRMPVCSIVSRNATNCWSRWILRYMASSCTCSLELVAALFSAQQFYFLVFNKQ